MYILYSLFLQYDVQNSRQRSQKFTLLRNRLATPPEMEEGNNDDNGGNAERRCYKEVTQVDRMGVFSMMMAGVENGHFCHGLVGEIATRFGIHCRTVTRIVKRGLGGRSVEDFIMGEHVPAVLSNRQNCGRTSKYDPTYLADTVKNLPIRARRTIRDLSESLKLPVGTTHRLINHSRSKVKRHNEAKTY